MNKEVNMEIEKDKYLIKGYWSCVSLLMFIAWSILLLIDEYSTKNLDELIFNNIMNYQIFGKIYSISFYDLFGLCSILFISWHTIKNIPRDKLFVKKLENYYLESSINTILLCAVLLILFFVVLFIFDLIFY